MARSIITYGTFDMFHIGHLNLFRKLKEIGDKLIVGVSTDEFNLIKGKRALFPYEQRSKIVQAIRYVDLVIPEMNWEQKIDDIKRYKIDVFAIGKDWEGKFDFLSEYCDVVYVDRTDGISTSDIKEWLRNLFFGFDRQSQSSMREVLEGILENLK